MRRGYLEQIETRKWLSKRKQIQQAGDHPDRNELMPVERKVFNFFTVPNEVSEIFSTVPMNIAPLFNEYQIHCEENDLLTTSEARKAAWWPGLAGAIVILGLGGFKLFDALDDAQRRLLFIACGLCSRSGLLQNCESRALRYKLAAQPANYI
ncbi:MAG: hypothetical protein JXM70_18485 [Pirellulales bacterium]|nr:hypothetical protein [Pirellulales bacterium]